jgi:IS30 family transposase
LNHLRHAGRKYRSKKSRQAGVHCILNRVDIAERPAIVAEKSRIGDWEGDTVISAGSRGFQFLSLESMFTHLPVILRSWDARVTATSGSMTTAKMDPDVALT